MDREDDNVKVFVRIRPLLSEEEIQNGSKSVALQGTDSLVLSREDQDPKGFTFDRILDEQTTQEEVFDIVGKPIAESCMKGYNGTILAYGMTGSGKTYTIQGELN